MSPVSVISLPSDLCLPTSFIDRSGRELIPLHITIPNVAMRRQGKLMTRASMSMNLRTAVSDDAVIRRRGDFHSNLWDDDLIQSLSSPYGEPSYRERAERLIGEVKNSFNSMSNEDGESITPLDDLIQRLWMVDSVERLGIDRHFKKEIKSALDHVYRYWSEKGIGCGRESVVTDLNSTALGLRTLRLHGYDVSADVLNHFKNQSGQFACTLKQTEDQIRTVLNLYRASLIAFPGEKVMDEAESFSAKYLKEALQKIPVSSFSREIGDVLEYGWHTYLPRLEARNYIDVFGQDTENSKSYMKTEKLLELAKLEFNIFHALQKRELEYLVRWWKGSGSPQMTFCRHRHVEYYTLASCIAFEPQHSGFRLGFAKACHIITVLDDMYDTFGTLDELELFTSAIKRWDPSATECLPEYMKGVYMIVYNTVNEMSQEADKAQGRDTLNYCRQAWEEYIDAYMQEAKWIASGEVPTFEEYYENGKVSSGHRVSALQPILTTDIPFPEHVLKEVDIPSQLNDLASAILRLRGDTRCYQADRARGEEASCISCYMKDNPGTTEEDALNHLNAMISDVIKGLNWELLKPNSSVPISAKKHAFDISRAFHCGYKYRDGYSVANIETKSLVKRTVIDPVTL
uniref:(-)-alpha-pinene synthase, chloroplastic n=1 Tax=Pinus taeda TaxID=3352 RepID=PT1_PINTA|nr:RecName: Full=(-)-alpha-pinene synthase, chloroplastic; AltName: Full=(+)-(3S:5S)-alpha-pinene synthase; AltName: Full=Synthase I; Flags: Precursor [Pinus taeda]AAO61225.1 (-)-alpha-pinene synthase [Pinus taeda]AIF29190.1 (-)-alpha-pinene synthase [Expression vector pPPG2]AIF29192.1 (-)-alpha-pinene synthase [Expression vector pPPG1]